MCRSSILGTLLVAAAASTFGCAGSSSHEDAEVATGAFTGCEGAACIHEQKLAFDKISEWAETNADCSSAVSWPQSMVTTGERDFEIVCGDTWNARRFMLHLETNLAVSVVSIGDAGHERQESGCQSDRCVLMKQAEFKAVRLWAENGYAPTEGGTPVRSITKTSDIDYRVVVGGPDATSTPRTFSARADNGALSENPANIIVRAL